MTEIRTAKELSGWSLRRPPRAARKRRTIEVNPDFESIWNNSRRIVAGSSLGTGCLVKHESRGDIWHVVVTNAHVVDGQARVECQRLIGSDLVTYWADVVAIDYTHDLAILEEDLPPGKFYDDEADGLSLGDCPRPGDSVTICGFPLGCETPRLVRGLVSGFEALPIEGNGITALVVQAPVNQGNSGGPVCIDDGTLAGIVFAINHRLRSGLVRPVAPTARQAVEYIERALVPVDGYGYVLDPADVGAMLDSHAYVRTLGENRTKYIPREHAMQRSDFVALQRAVAAVDLPANCSCIGPFNFNHETDQLLLGFHGEEQRHVDAPAAWITLCRQLSSWHFYLRGYTIVAYHKKTGYKRGIWVDKIMVNLLTEDAGSLGQ